MDDLSIYLAERTCRTILGKTGGTAFCKGLFDSQGGNRFEAWHEYKVSFYDYGERIEIAVENDRNGSILKLADKLEDAKFEIPEGYRAILSHVGYSVHGEDKELVMTVRPRMRKGVRKRNKDKIFHSVDDCALSKLLKAIYESK